MWMSSFESDLSGWTNQQNLLDSEPKPNFGKEMMYLRFERGKWLSWKEIRCTLVFTVTRCQAHIRHTCIFSVSASLSRSLSRRSWHADIDKCAIHSFTNPANKTVVYLVSVFLELVQCDRDPFTPSLGGLQQKNNVYTGFVCFVWSSCFFFSHFLFRRKNNKVEYLVREWVYHVAYHCRGEEITSIQPQACRSPKQRSRRIVFNYMVVSAIYVRNTSIIAAKHNEE